VDHAEFDPVIERLRRDRFGSDLSDVVLYTIVMVRNLHASHHSHACFPDAMLPAEANNEF